MPELISLSGKQILVTGGTTGIGRETVAMLATAGARVLTFGRHQTELEHALAHARAGGGEVIGLTADAARREDIEHVFRDVDQRLGGIDILICCAALGADPIDEMAADEWRYVVETNLLGYLACARAALDRMRPQGSGHLLFVSSISTAIKAPGESVYSATKAAIEAFAETLRKEIAEANIKVSVIQPGSVATDMQPCSEPEKREAVAREEMLHAEEIADAIRYVLTRSWRTDVVNLRLEPRLQKTS
jgi:NAD(P)-dependent dehydrogenase (short-subunit alcohol dehydrogenase family)